MTSTGTDRPPRHDLPWLRRRTRPTAPPAPTPIAASTPAAIPTSAAGPQRAAAPATRSTGLVLGAPAAPPVRNGSSEPAVRVGAPVGGARPDRAATRLVRPFPAPSLDDLDHLSPDEPVVRVSRLRSAIGAMSVTGATSIAWESTSLVTGGRTVDGASAGVDVHTSGNRPLVGYDARTALVSLRHVRELRRALFIARSPEPIRVRFADGQRLTVEPAGPTATGVPEPDTVVILSLLRIDGMLELRREVFTKAVHDGVVHQAFGFRMSIPNADPTEG